MEKFSMDVAGRKMTMEVGRLAQQASGSVFLTYGDTAVLVTASVAAEAREGMDFLPLTVDYEERLYAVGKIPGGFIKREGRPTEKAVLSARLTDRPLRPLFPKGFHNAVHVVATVLSVDQDCPPEALVISGASAALSISQAPFTEPVASVIVGLVDGEYVINPTQEQTENTELHLVVAGTEDAIMMVEAGANELSEEKMLEAILKGHDEIKKIVALQNEMVAKVGKEKMEVVVFEPLPEIKEKVEKYATDLLETAIKHEEKKKREEEISEVKKQVKEKFEEEYPENSKDIKYVFEKVLKSSVRRMIIEESVRPDGRKPDEIRPISVEVGILERTHGTGLFRRGQTQVLGICTLGPMGDMQKLDGLGINESKRFMHHYNFPPFSVGETGFMRGPGRREIGHGALAERALEPVLPSGEDFPYTIRLVSEVLESNGSSSMGSVCAGSLSMMQAGIPLKKAVAGIAMGLVKEENDVAILSDIQGMEDFLGDMDFKIAGTKDGITALQMDIKIKGLSRELLSKALEQGRKGYLFIMGEMNKVIDSPSESMSKYAPKIMTIKIDPNKIRDVIGPGGKMINKIITETGAQIDIEPDGKVFIAAVDSEGGDKARAMIENLTKSVEAGEIYLGKVTRTEKYGAFVEVLPGKDGLVHISHLDHNRVAKTEDVVKVGDEVMVKVLDIDDKGRINLSRKEAMNKGEKK